MAIDLPQHIPVQYLSLSKLIKRNITIGLLRLDTIHRNVSGNKWFKLKENVKLAQENHYDTILTFGGAYSNHLSATAAAAKLLGIKAIAIVRGMEFADKLNPTLLFCKAQEMKLHFVSREEYKLKSQPEFLQTISEQYKHPYIIPEGGNNAAGVNGAELIGNYIPQDATHIVVSVGSGTTMQGILNAMTNKKDKTLQSFVLGMSPIKGGSYLKASIQTAYTHWDIIDKYHFGGFGKYNDALIDFMNAFYSKHQMPLDAIYTAKMMYGVEDLIGQNYFPEGSKIICIHTGGLQGNQSLKERLHFDSI